MGRILDKHIADNAAINPNKIGGFRVLRKGNRCLYVDGSSGSDSNSGLSAYAAKATIQAAVTAANPWDTIYVFPKDIPITATDPVSYVETVIIPNTKPGLSIVGVCTGRTQGGLPQMKIGAGSTAMITIRAPGCSIENMGINGGDSTGGGILLDDNGTSKVAMGTTLFNCHFKNCKAHATHASVGGAIYCTDYPPWQVLVENCIFFKCTGGIVIPGSTVIAQDWVIKNCEFTSSVATDVDADIYIYNCLGLVIDNCRFATVDVPAKASGDIGRYIKLGTGTFGMLSNCTFACMTNESATEISFGTTGSGGVIPTTVRMVHNYGETDTSGTMESGEIFRKD